MSSYTTPALRCLVLVALAVFGMAGCTRHDAAAYIASAKSYMAKADYRAAVIEVKNALQQAPDNGEARLLLAQGLLATGDPAGAEAEIRKAIDLRVPDDRTYPVLAQSLVQQGQYAKLLTETGDRKLETPAARADLEVSRAAAYLGQGDRDNAQVSVDRSLADAPGNVRALLLSAQLAQQRGDMPASRKFVQSALERAPNDADALRLSAQIEATAGNFEEAGKYLQRAIDAHPRMLELRFAMTSLALTAGKLDVAKSQIAKMKEMAPADGRTLYSDAIVAYAENDNVRARDDVQRVLAINPNHLPSLMLSGLVNARLGSYGAAEEAFRAVAARATNEPTVVRALSELYLRTGRVPDALQTVERAVRDSPDNAEMLRTAGEVYLASGDLARAEKAYERANTKEGKADMTSQVRLAQVRLATGDTQRAFSDLESLAERDSSNLQADFALFRGHLQRREYEKALAAVDGIEKKRPNGPLAPYLRGTVYLAKRDIKNARVNLDAALELRPDFFPAAYGLAILDLQDARPQLARERFDRMLQKNPKNEQLLIASAELLAMSGGSPEQVRAAFDKAIDANPASTRSRLALVTYLARHNDLRAALAVAQAAIAAIPNDAQLTAALGALQLANGDGNQAVETFKRGVELEPQNPVALLRLAHAQVTLKDYSSAVTSERKVLALSPNLTQIYLDLARTYLLWGRPDEIIAEARRLQKEQPNKAIGYVLEGEVLAAQKKWAEAAVASKAALAREPTSSLAARTYGLLLASGKSSDAENVARKWSAEHPKDLTMPLILAQQAMARRDIAAARMAYEHALQIDADNTLALNNLAWILSEAKDPRALEYAERAHRLAPFDPHVLDTLGWTFTQVGQAQRGVEILRMATSLAPRDGDIGLHFAKALMESGDKTGAKRELTRISKLEKDSVARSEAEKLLVNQ